MLLATHRDEDRARHYRANGLWEDRRIANLFSASVERSPDAVAVTDAEHTMTYGELGELVDRLARRLAGEFGVTAGDVVGYQLPNWWETVVVLQACARLGAVLNPLQMVYRESDLRFVLERTRPRVVFTPAWYNGRGYVADTSMARDRAGVDTAICAVRGADGTSSVEALVGSASAATALPPRPQDHDAVSLVLYTSGTTSRPKGALHTDNTLIRMVRDMTWTYQLGADDAIFIPSTMTHVSGLSFIWSALFTGARAVLMSAWDRTRAVELVMRTGATFVGGATPFIQGLITGVREAGIAPADVPLRRGNCGSADVPPDLIRTADETLGAPFSRGYGLTEGIIISVSRPDDTFTNRGSTDGAVLPTNEVRIVDHALRDVGPGEAGEILVRGPSNFVGYLDPADNEGSFADGSWIRTGDLGRFPSPGYLLITGRLKDMISRGGENISVKEVEDIALSDPRLAEIAIVSMPDPVMGERACAFVVPANGVAGYTLADLVAVLDSAGMAKHKWPERLEVRTTLPTTATGKVQKAALREEIRQMLAREQTPADRPA